MPECQKIKQGWLDQYEYFGIDSFWHNQKTCGNEKVKWSLAEPLGISQRLGREIARFGFSNFVPSLSPKSVLYSEAQTSVPGASNKLAD